MLIIIIHQKTEQSTPQYNLFKAQESNHNNNNNTSPNDSYQLFKSQQDVVPRERPRFV
jgi:hypothetical protein